MTFIVDRELADFVVAQTQRRLQAQRATEGASRPDIVTWSERNFYIPETGMPIRFEPFQKAVLWYAFPPGLAEGFRFSLVVYSTIKKSGKTTIGGVVGRWVAEARSRSGEVYTLGNDQRQAKERSFTHIKRSLELTPGYRRRGAEGMLPDRWLAQSNRLDCLTTGTKIEALAVDARGEAGGNPDLTIWTELWGFESLEAIRFFHELTPVPTKPSCRFVETYAGFEGESELLREIYEDARSAGRQLTAGELAADTGVPLGCFAEAPAADDLVPIWVNEEIGLFMYWDSGTEARRMTWQLGEEGQKYYLEQEQRLPGPQYERLHHNFWVGGEGDFIPMSAWDACLDPSLPALPPGDRTPAILAVDAATTGDCFGIVLITRHPERHTEVAIRHCRLWTPPKGGRIDYEGPEGFIRTLAQGGCMLGHPQRDPWRRAPEACDHANLALYGCDTCCGACRDGALAAPYNILEIAYDPYQLESMMQRLYKEGINCQGFNQGTERLKADSALYDLILNRQIAHAGQLELRQHIQNAGSKQSKDEDTKLRIIKKENTKKIDLVVATSMGASRCLYYLLALLPGMLFIPWF